MSIIKNLFYLCYENSIELCLGINNRTKNKYIKMFLLILCAPYMLVRMAYRIIMEKTVATIRIQKIKNKDKSIIYKYQLAVVAIAKNESNNIREWVAYHISLGVDKVYLYDNESDDTTKEEILDYIEKGIVEYIYFPGKNKQIPAYNHAISCFKNDCKYMAFIDCDEFIAVPKEENIKSVVDRIISEAPNAGGLGINWALYGSSGYIKRQPGLLIETYLRRGDNFAWPNYHVKTIVNPRLVKNYISPHFPVYYLGAWSVDSKKNRQRLWFNHDVNFDLIRCNHYFCKSKEEFIEKRSRGMADRQAKYDMTKFDEYDLNDVHDTIMLSYVDQTKTLMK